MRRKRSVVTGRAVASIPTRRRVPLPGERRRGPQAGPDSAAGARPAPAPTGRARRWSTCSIDLAPTPAGCPRAAQPDPGRLGHLRLRHRVRRGRGCRPPRRHLLQGHDPQGARRQSAAAGDRDAGRDAQLHRPPEPGRRCGAGEVRRRAGSTWQVPVIVNVAGESVEDYVARRRASSTSSPAWRVSSSTSAAPTWARAASSSRSTRGRGGEVTAAVRRATELPLLVKLSPAATDVRGIARAIADAGADAICAVNTLLGDGHRPTTTQAAAGQHVRRPVGAGAQAGRAAGRVRGGPGGATSRSWPSAA